jgi:polysaccharide biosynthesis/export protein
LNNSTKQFFKLGNPKLAITIFLLIAIGGFAQAPEAGEAYRIRPDDVLEIYVIDVPEVSRQCRVSPDGFISVAMLPPIPASGMRLAALSERVANDLRDSGLVSNPHVTVSVVQSRLSSVSITGAVRKPQIYPVFGETTLLDLLSQAEGLEEDAGDTLFIQGNGKRIQPVSVNVTRLLNGDGEMNVTIVPGDRITVPRAGVVYVVGAVNKPGGFQLGLNRQRISLLQAVALAEDLKTTALRSKALLIRSGSSGTTGRSEGPVDLKRVLEGKSADLELRADDILFVPDSSSRKFIKRGAEAVLQVATGVAIYGRY